VAHRDPRFDVFIGDRDDPPSHERADPSLFRVALVGDFSARSTHPDSHANAPRRRVVPVSVDSMDDAIATVRPRIVLALDPSSAPEIVEFSELDDFHPDRIAGRLGMVQGLIGMRGEAVSPAPSRPAPRSRADTSATAATLAGGSLLDMIVDASPAPPASAPASSPGGTDDLADFVRDAVRPHAVHESRPADPALIDKIDAVLEATMRAVLHDPGLQTLEALWRGVDFFLRRLTSDAHIDLVLVDLTRDELVASLAPAADAGGRSALQGLLGPSSPSLIVVTHALGGDGHDESQQLAACARALGAPVLVDAAPGFVGLTSFVDEPDPDDWTLSMPEHWDSLRRSAEASHLGVVLPRVLLREPYGAATEACSVVPFEEISPSQTPAEAHDAYLWGSGALAAALVIANVFADDGTPGTHGTLDNLPLHVRTIDGEPTATPPTEVVLGSRAVTRLLDAGITPLVAMRDGDAVRAPRIQSIAVPPRPLAIVAAGAGE
jgi:predicted component of type VI protein secretion system